MKPKRIECNLIPRNAIDLSGQPQLCRFNNFVLYGRVGMAIYDDGVIYAALSDFNDIVNEETIFGMSVIPLVEVFRAAVTIHC
jgi:hypothetical protein